MKIYIGGSFHDQKRVEHYTVLLKDCGFEPTNSWQDEDPKIAIPFECAIRDLQGIDEAEALLILMDTESTSGGYWVELGYAVAKNKPIFVVGSFSKNIFLQLPGVNRNFTFSDALVELLKFRRRRKGLAKGYEAPVTVTSSELPPGY